jgi:hypothetical protein
MRDECLYGYLSTCAYINRTHSHVIYISATHSISSKPTSEKSHWAAIDKVDQSVSMRAPDTRATEMIG